MIKIYGTRQSRAFRCLWTLEECELDHELVEVDWQSGETRTPEFLALNPNGHVPVFQHGDLVLVESLAINLHICQLAQTPISHSGEREETLAMQWTIWAMGELEGPHDSANRQGMDIDDALIAGALNVLNQKLADGLYLISDRFTVADLNVASVLMRPKYLPHIQSYENVDAWFQRIAARPALAKALGRS